MACVHCHAVHAISNDRLLSSTISKIKENFTTSDMNINNESTHWMCPSHWTNVCVPTYLMQFELVSFTFLCRVFPLFFYLSLFFLLSVRLLFISLPPSSPIGRRTLLTTHLFRTFSRFPCPSPILDCSTSSSFSPSLPLPLFLSCPLARSLSSSSFPHVPTRSLSISPSLSVCLQSPHLFSVLLSPSVNYLRSFCPILPLLFPFLPPFTRDIRKSAAPRLKNQYNWNVNTGYSNFIYGKHSTSYIRFNFD